jgi:hypothetical protein
MTTLDHDDLAFTALASDLDLDGMADGASLASTAILDGTRIRRRRKAVGWSLTTVAAGVAVFVASGVADSAPHAAAPAPSSRPAAHGRAHHQAAAPQAARQATSGWTAARVYQSQDGQWVLLRVLHP